jgi:hypothetical protein
MKQIDMIRHLKRFSSGTRQTLQSRHPREPIVVGAQIAGLTCFARFTWYKGENNNPFSFLKFTARNESSTAGKFMSQ